MAHRKPLGSKFESTFDWEGPHPRLLDYLVSGAGTWYRTVGVVEKRNPEKVGLMLERIAGPTGERFQGPNGRWGVSEDGHIRFVHGFVWYPRTKRAS